MADVDEVWLKEVCQNYTYVSERVNYTGWKSRINVDVIVSFFSNFTCDVYFEIWKTGYTN